eukprot:Phypoly_transcript_06524.p1 GENE.Phypoly_transcript_06524~~Phypoly_transcript_06524.p1  ORF type:complete len:457 (+),score=39.40 Phypoly_transcript_06524:113-1483(+)
MDNDNGDQTCVYSWGSTASLITTHVKKEDLPRIIEVFDTARVIKVACSSTFSLALTANGRVWWWGYQGSALRAQQSFPALVPDLEDVFVKDIACTTPGGDHNVGHSACITDKQDLYMWGSNAYRQLGCEMPACVEKPVKVAEKVSRVACGDHHTIAIFGDGDVYTWGVNNARTPVLSGSKVVQVEAGGFGFCGALTADHTLYTWANTLGVSEGDFLGHGSGRQFHLDGQPKPVESLRNQVKYFACGWIHAGAVTLNGDLYTWGEGDTNRLGHGEPRNDRNRHKHVPTLVKGMEGTHIKKLTLSRGNEGAITESGDVYTWGGNDHGGHHLHSTPTKLELSSTFFQEAEVKDLSCGKSHTVIVLHMRTSLRYLCIRKIAQHIEDLLPHVIHMPCEIREALCSFLVDRRMLTPKIAKSLNVRHFIPLCTKSGNSENSENPDKISAIIRYKRMLRNFLGL